MNERQGPTTESGHLLITLMIAITVMSILLGAAFQQWSVIVHRDKEEELIFRGGQYVDAIIRYRMDHGGALPTSLADLAKPGPRGFRFIRKLFTDPFEIPTEDGGDEWQLAGFGDDEEGRGWGLLYLGPGGKWIYDPQAAQRAAEGAGHSGGNIPPEFQNRGLTSTSAGFGGIPGLPGIGQGMPGGLGPGTPGGLPAGPTGAGLPGQGLQPRGLPGAVGGLQGQLPVGGQGLGGGFPVGGAALGQQIVGVVSRSGKKGFRRYQQREIYWDWQFHIFTVLRVPTQRQTPGGPRTPTGRGLGPGGKLFPPGTVAPPPTPKGLENRPKKPN